MASGIIFSIKPLVLAKIVFFLVVFLNGRAMGLRTKQGVEGFSSADGAHKGNVCWYAEGVRALSVVIIKYLRNKGIVPGNSGSEVCHTTS